jgi:hypothetical protein
LLQKSSSSIIGVCTIGQSGGSTRDLDRYLGTQYCLTNNNNNNNNNNNKNDEAVEREIGDFPSTGPYEAERMLGGKVVLDNLNTEITGVNSAWDMDISFYAALHRWRGLTIGSYSIKESC